MPFREERHFYGNNIMEILNADKIRNAVRAIALNTLVNDYAVERVAFGFEKPGDKAPIDLYLSHLRLSVNDGLHKRADIPGVYIDEQERISAELDYAEYVRDLFVYQMECIFINAPKDIYKERTGEEIPLLPRFREYLFGLLPLFTEVLSVEVANNVFDVIPIADDAMRSAKYQKLQKFVTAVLLKPLRSGGQINRYVKDITFAPHYVSRLIEKKGKNFYLKHVDIESYEYIFALFSLMQFTSGEHYRLLELKMREWERRHKPE